MENSEQHRKYGSWVVCLAIAMLFVAASAAQGEDGYRLWRRYDQLPAQALTRYRTQVSEIVVSGQISDA